MKDHLQVFTRRLHEEWLPAFCNDSERNHSASGFKNQSIKISDFDAGNFLRAIDGGLVTDIGGGRYRCARSNAFEQLFWTGRKSVQPRPLTLWVEPVVTIATIARLHLDFDWPAELLGMQSKDWAFDFAVYGSRTDGSERVAGEVKKSKAEVDGLVQVVSEYGRSGATTPMSKHPKNINAFKKWIALLRRKAPLFWVVGPNDYTRLFEVAYQSEGAAMFTEVGLASLWAKKPTTSCST